MASNLEDELAALKLCAKTGIYKNKIAVASSKPKNTQLPVVSFGKFSSILFCIYCINKILVT